MKKLLEVLVVAGLLVGYADAQGPGARIYFDLDGNVPMSQDENDAPHPGATAKENPVLVGAGRLYIYWEFGGTQQSVFSPNYDITVDDGSIIAAWNYNNTNMGNIGFSTGGSPTGLSPLTTSWSLGTSPAALALVQRTRRWSTTRRFRSPRLLSTRSV